MDNQQGNEKEASDGFRQVMEEEVKKIIETGDQVGPEMGFQCAENVFRRLAGGDGASLGDGSLPSSGTGLGNNAGGVPFRNTGPEYIKPGEATAADKEAADDLKNKGDDAMMRLQFLEGLDCYSKAIALDGNNPFYFCNRSAAHIKLEEFGEAVRDCQIAIQLEPSYARAYGRMGLAYSLQDNHIDACLCYVKAVALDPQNQTYRTNLQVAQQRVEIPDINTQDEASTIQWLETFYQNPNMAYSASQIMQGPLMQTLRQFITQLVRDGGRGPQADDGGAEQGSD